MKTCNECKRELSIDKFYTHGFRKDSTIVWNGRCKECMSAQGKLLRIKTYKQRRKAQLKIKYQMSLVDFDKLLESQDGGCAICKSKIRLLVIDHDHITGQVRGILCRQCNSGLGWFQDNPNLFDLAKNYLLRNRGEGS